MKLNRHLFNLLAFIVLAFGATSAWAAMIQQVKGNKALIVLQGLSVQPGTELFAINSEQKRRAVLRVTQVRGDRAVAEITNGAAANGMMIIVKSGGGAPRGAPPPAAAPAFGSPAPYSAGGGYGQPTRTYKKGWGVVGGLAMSTMALTVKTTTNPAGENLALKGTSFNMKGIMDYHLSPKFTIRGAAGLETLSVTGAAGNLGESCSFTTSCALTLNYLTLEGNAQFNFVNAKHRIWAGAGFGFLIAMSKGNNISNLEASSTNQVLLLGGGADFKLNNTTYMPVVIEYGLFPFAGISLSSIYMRGGIAWKF